jgi:hypothetical protein
MHFHADLSLRSDRLYLIEQLGSQPMMEFRYPLSLSQPLPIQFSSSTTFLFFSNQLGLQSTVGDLRVVAVALILCLLNVLSYQRELETTQRKEKTPLVVMTQPA